MGVKVEGGTHEHLYVVHKMNLYMYMPIGIY